MAALNAPHNAKSNGSGAQAKRPQPNKPPKMTKTGIVTNRLAIRDSIGEATRTKRDKPNAVIR